MSTYSFDDTLSTAKDRVRWRSGDVNGDPKWFTSDETITALLAEYGNDVDEVAAQCCESIGAQCIQLADGVQQRNLKLSYTNRAQQAFNLADRIRNKTKTDSSVPAATGAAFASMQEPDISKSGISLPRHDPNRVWLSKDPPSVP